MSNTDFTTTVEVNSSAAEAFNAINNVRGWWSEEIEGSTDKLHDIFKYHYLDVHRCTIKITALEPNAKVKWHVLDNYFQFTKDATEWTGTDILFEISEQQGKTTVKFTHIGLTPHYECYDICHDAWSTYIQSSLRNLIETGEGRPNATGKPQTDAEKELGEAV